jgi:hypothetical protein
MQHVSKRSLRKVRLTIWRHIVEMNHVTSCLRRLDLFNPSMLLSHIKIYMLKQLAEIEAKYICETHSIVYRILGRFWGQ